MLFCVGIYWISVLFCVLPRSKIKISFKKNQTKTCCPRFCLPTFLSSHAQAYFPHLCASYYTRSRGCRRQAIRKLAPPNPSGLICRYMIDNRSSNFVECSSLTSNLLKIRLPNLGAGVRILACVRVCSCANIFATGEQGWSVSEHEGAVLLDNNINGVQQNT